MKKLIRAIKIARTSFLNAMKDDELLLSDSSVLSIINWYNRQIDKPTGVDCIIRTILLKKSRTAVAYPTTVAEFSQCLVFFKSVPEIADNMYKMKGVCFAWHNLSTKWDEMKSLHAANKTDELLATIKWCTTMEA